MDINVNVNISHLPIIRKPLTILWQNFIVDHHVYLVPVSFLSPECADFPNCFKGFVVDVCWSQLAVSFRCMEISIWNHSGNNTNQYPACSYWTHCSVLRSWAFLYRDVDIECHKARPKNSYAVFVTAVVLPRGYMGIHWRWSVETEHPESGWSWSGELDALSLST